MLFSSSAAFGLISLNPYTSFKTNTHKMVFQTISKMNKGINAKFTKISPVVSIAISGGASTSFLVSGSSCVSTIGFSSTSTCFSDFGGGGSSGF